MASGSVHDAPLETSSKAYVLYVDHQGHPAPLTECFHATASRRLSSTVYRYPVATMQEVDSAYCPQCLTFHDAATGALLGYCPKASCRRCPLCLSVATVHTDPPTGTSGGIECFYKCGFCDWTSKDCQLSVTVSSDDDNKLGRLELMRASEDMSVALTERRKQARQPVEALHKYVTEQWSNHSKQQRRNDKNRHEDDWSLERLEAKLLERAANLHFDHSDYPLPNVPGLEVKRMSIQDILKQDSEALPANRYPNDVSLLSYHFQSLDAEPLLPLPIPLALRQSRRCRAELAEGRPGILLKPKLNPLEGDSSLPTGHGQWHRKVSFRLVSVS